MFGRLNLENRTAPKDFKMRANERFPVCCQRRKTLGHVLGIEVRNEAIILTGR